MATVLLKPKKTKGENSGLGSNEIAKSDQILSPPPTKPREPLVDIPPVWSWFFLALTLLYLTGEALFNTELVSVMGGSNASVEDRDAVELFGRVVSSTGASLLVAGLLIHPLWRRQMLIRKKRHALGSLILLVSLVWPSVFYGQNWFIENEVIESSSAQERQRALFSQTVKDALILNAVDIEGIPYNSTDYSHTPSEMTFITLLPALMYSDTDLVNKIDRQKEKVIRNFYTNKFHLGFDQIYEAFKTVRANLVGRYNEYSEQSNRYVDTLNSSSKETQKVIKDLEQRMSAGYSEYKQTIRGFQGQAKSKAKPMADDFYKYMTYRNRYVKSGSRDRLRKLDAKFDTQMRQQGFAGVDRSYFFVDKNTFSDSPEHMRKKLLGLMYSKFEREQGYPVNLTEKGFMTHPVILQKMRRGLISRGIAVSDNWQRGDNRTLSKAVREKIKRDLDSAWNSNELVKEYGVVPNMTWREFYSAPKVQRAIKEQLQVDENFRFIDLDWNNANFKRFFVDSLITTETKKLSESLDKPLAHFAGGGSLEDESRVALKDTLLPAYSMGLSLALVFLTVLRLPIGLFINLVTTPRAKLVVRVLAPVAAIGLILFYPLVSSAARNNSTVSYLLDAVKEHASTTEALALEWIINSQPIIYPYGKFVENIVPISNEIMLSAGATGSHIPTGNPLLNLTEEDLKELGLIPQSGSGGIFDNETHAESDANTASVEKTSDKPEQEASATIVDAATVKGAGKLPLTIIAVPANSAVKILDIREPYKPGILLEPREYQVEVSAAGYQTVQKNITLSNYKSEFRVELAKKEARRAEPDSEFPLTIVTNPPSARVRVMNISPKYRAGMMLAPGLYKIEVTAPGYQTENRNVTLSSENTRFSFELLKAVANTEVKPKPVEVKNIGSNGQPISQAAMDFSQFWQGYYTCGKERRFDLQVIALGGDHIEAETKFQATSNTVGRYKLAGTVTSNGFELEPVAWIAQPPGYKMGGFSGTVSKDKLSITGNINDDACDGFVAYLQQ